MAFGNGSGGIFYVREGRLQTLRVDGNGGTCIDVRQGTCDVRYLPSYLYKRMPHDHRALPCLGLRCATLAAAAAAEVDNDCAADDV